MLPNIMSVKGNRIVAIHCHQGVHIGRRVETTYNIEKGFHLAWDKDDLGIVIVYIGADSFDIKTGDMALASSAILHSATLESAEGRKIVLEAKDSVEQAKLEAQQRAIDGAIEQRVASKPAKAGKA